jgi:hypothetical protein
MPWGGLARFLEYAAPERETGVRRPVGRHTPAVHALLDHLLSVGFDGAPEQRGIDDWGREVLAYVPGRIHMPRRKGPLGIDAAVGDTAQLLYVTTTRLSGTSSSTGDDRAP